MGQLQSFITFILENIGHGGNEGSSFSSLTTSNSREFDDLAYLVDSMFDLSENVRNWSLFISLLLDHKTSLCLSDVEIKILLKMLVFAARKAAGEDIIPSQPGYPGPRKLTARERERLPQLQEEMSAAFVEVITELIRTFQSDAAKIADVVLLPAYFSPNTFATHHKENDHAELLKLLSSTFEKHVSSAVVHNVCLTFSTLIADSNSLKADAQREWNTLMDRIVAAYKNAATQNDNDALGFALTRLQAISAVHPLNGSEIWIATCVVLERSLAGEVTVEVAEKVCALSFEILCAAYMHLSSSELQGAPGGLLPSTVIEMRDFAVSHLDALLTNGQATVQNAAFKALAGVLELGALSSSPAFSALQYSPPETVQTHLYEFMMGCMQQALALEDETGSEDEDDSEASLEKASAVDTLVATFFGRFARLVAFRFVDPDKYIPLVLKQYLYYGNVGAEVVKKMFAEIRNSGDEMEWAYILESLQSLFDDYLHHTGSKDEKRAAMDILVDTSSKLAGAYALFGDRDINRTLLRKIVEAGVEYALERPDNSPVGSLPSHIEFLECLHPFTRKMHTDDIDRLSRNLNHSAPRLRPENSTAWKPYHNFVDKLIKPSKTPGTTRKSAKRFPDQSTVRRKKSLHSESGSSTTAGTSGVGERRARRKLGLNHFDDDYNTTTIDPSESTEGTHNQRRSGRLSSVNRRSYAEDDIDTNEGDEETKDSHMSGVDSNQPNVSSFSGDVSLGGPETTSSGSGSATTGLSGFGSSTVFSESGGDDTLLGYGRRKRRKI
eukprot:GCRY01006629.1.p1 GENE.GCRY01006629.1~~GCRY01006629.1.p1  ORF type:complete len:813 (-),score=134.81 GCRY01006629.1:182-2524(-)